MLNSAAPSCMLITNDLNPTNGFTRVLNDAIFSDSLTNAEFRLWCQLLALPRGRKEIHMETSELANEVGLTQDTCRDHRRQLKNKGFLRLEKGRLIVTCPDEDFEPAEEKMPKGRQLRHDLRDVWNANKPDAYSKLKNPVSDAQVLTLTEHAKHNEVPDLKIFLKAVLSGCKADDWWKEKNLNLSNVFGTGTPKQNKFTNVEKLYKLAGSKKGQAANFDVDTDGSWLDWYKSKAHAMTKVVRLEMSQDDAWTHQVDNDGDGTIYVYSHEGRLVHWTYKEGQHGVSYLPTAR
jgi:DNA-binding Lrp family transcriptional regulator